MHENPGSATQLLGGQPALDKPRVQFTTQSLLLCMGYLGCLIWLVQFIFRAETVRIPLFMHLWFVVLWTSVVYGTFMLQNASPYVIAGMIGVGLTSPVLIDIFLQDFEAIPLVTGWSASFIFAMFA